MAEQQGSIQIAPVFRRWARAYTLAPGQGGGRVPAYWRDVLARDPWLRDAVMVVELVLGGVAAVKVIRVATEPVQAVTDTGVAVDVLPLLIEEPEVAQEYTLGDGTSSARSLTLTIDGRVLDAPAVLRNGGILAGFAEVYLLPRPRHPGDQAEHARRYVLIRGDVTTVRFGAGAGATEAQRRGEIAELEVVDPKETIGTKLPPWVLTTERWPTLHESAIGERYPIVLNGYRTVPALRITSTTVGSQRFVYAYGNATDYPAIQVYVNGDRKLTSDPVYGWNNTTEVDDLGDTVSAIQFTVGTTAWTDSDAVHVTVEATESYGVVEALRYVLESYSPLGLQGSSPELYSTAIARMGVSTGVRLLVNASGGGNGATALEWAEGGYLAALPMLSMVWENGAYGPVVTDRRLPPSAHWHVGRGVLLDRETLVEETGKADLCNDFVLRYDYDPMLDLWRGVLVRGPYNSDVCAFSESLMGRREAEPIDAAYIASEELATYVIDWMVDHMALPSYVVDYVARPDVLMRYRRGDRVDITDDELEWSRVPATIQAIRYRRGQAVVTLRVWLGYLADLSATTRTGGT